MIFWVRYGRHLCVLTPALTVDPVWGAHNRGMLFWYGDAR